MKIASTRPAACATRRTGSAIRFGRADSARAQRRGRRGAPPPAGTRPPPPCRRHCPAASAANERLPLRDGVVDDALDVGLRQEAQQIDAARGDVGVGRERDHRNVALARDCADRADRLREQRAEDDLGAFVDRLLRGCCAPCGVPPSSFTSSWMFGLLNSASAISAAFFIDCAATPALPCADSGRIRPTLTWPGADRGGGRRFRAPAADVLLKNSELPPAQAAEQPRQLRQSRAPRKCGAARATASPAQPAAFPA